jgi:multidrug efflux system outer membrane protein
MKLNKYIIALFVSVVFWACQTSKNLDKKDLKAMPDAYASAKDSSSSANINWKQYFSDPDLLSLIDEALKNNSDMLIALQRIEGARSGVILNRGALFPNLNANISYLQRKFGYYTMDDAGNRTTEIEPGKIVPTHLPDYFIGLQTSWEIDVWGKLRNRKKAAFARYFASVEGKNLVVTNLIAEVANNYYELLALDNELDITKETIKLQENALDLVKIQKIAGTTTELAVKEFEAQMFNSKAMEYEILQNIAECENKINYLLGRYPQLITRDKTKLDKEIPIKASTGIPSDLLKNRPDIRQAEFEMIAAKANVKAARAAFFPSLNINGSLGFQGYKAALLFTNPQSIAYSALGSLMAPLINRAAIKAEFKSANAAQVESFYNYQKTILNGYVEVYNEVARIKNLEKIVEFRAQEVKSLNEAMVISSELFKTGKATYVEVLMTSQKSALESKLQLVTAKKRQYNAVINIYKALGGGWK